jgi:hypothetical protein
METMGLRAYARYRGVSLAAVQKAISSERISLQPDGRINAEDADRQWEANTAWRFPNLASRNQELGVPMNEDTHAEARARLAYYEAEAELANLKLRQRVGELVRKDDVQKAAARAMRQLRIRIMRIPVDLAKLLAAETDAARCYEILNTEIREALTGFADSNG